MLQEKRGFKYSLLVVITMKRWKSESNEWEFVNICLRPDAITVIYQRFYLDNACTQILNLLDKWQGEASGWTIDSIQDINFKINDYEPLAGSTYIPLPSKLSNPKHGLINIKKTDV